MNINLSKTKYINETPRIYVSGGLHQPFTIQQQQQHKELLLHVSHIHNISNAAKSGRAVILEGLTSITVCGKQTHKCSVYVQKSGANADG